MAKNQPKGSKKVSKRAARDSRGQEQIVAPIRQHEPDVRYIKRTTTLKPKNKAQADYLQLIESQSLIFGVGPAGTGKSFVATKWAAQQLEDRRISKIIITRPAVEAEENMGFLPGEIQDKFAPYFKPIREILEGHFGASAVDCYIKNGRIEIAPLAYLRGSTFEDAFVLLDEAQNTTIKQMKLFLTRIGPNCTVVVDGDTDQVDIPEANGLADALERFKDMADTGFKIFTEEDIVRSGMCREIIKRYRKAA